MYEARWDTRKMLRALDEVTNENEYSNIVNYAYIQDKS
jgi:hypothetical protein